MYLFFSSLLSDCNAWLLELAMGVLEAVDEEDMIKVIWDEIENSYIAGRRGLSSD